MVLSRPHCQPEALPMSFSMTQSLGQIKQELARVLDDQTLLAACHAAGLTWRERLLDPLTTIRLFLLQIAHGNTACSHLPHLTGQRFTPSAYCQARKRLPLAVLEDLL